MPSARYVVFKGVSHLLQSENLISAKFEKLGVLFEKLRELNIKRLMFAGAMSRPSLNFEEFDPFNSKRSAGVGVRVFMPAFGLLGIDFGYGFDNADPTQNTANGWETHFIIGQQF